MSNVLVTGGAGYIGSHTCKALARAGFTPVTYDNLVYGHREFVKWGPFVEGELGDMTHLARTFRKYAIDSVIHFAAYAYVGESMLDPGKYFRNNVVCSLNLLDTMVASKVKHIVFSSTCATYGLPEFVPIGEDHPQRPVNPYGESKLFVEKTLHWHGIAHDLRWFALRYFNAAGADPEGELGEEHDPETHLIPLVIKTALGQRSHVDLYGSDYPTSDGTAIRDYIHVQDLADAHVLSLKYLLTGRPSNVSNLGTGTGHSVKQVIDMVENVTGKRVNVRLAPRRLGDPPALVANPCHAKRLLGWGPRSSDLKTIVETAWHWHRAHPESIAR